LQPTNTLLGSNHSYLEDNVAVAAIELPHLVFMNRHDLELFNTPDPETCLGSNTRFVAPSLLKRTSLFAVLLIEFAAERGQVGLLEFYLVCAGGEVSHDLVSDESRSKGRVTKYLLQAEFFNMVAVSRCCIKGG